MKDKYIFSNGCPFCNGQHGDNWMTIDNNSKSEVVLRPGETLIFEDGQLKSYIFTQDTEDRVAQEIAFDALEADLKIMGLI